MKPHPRIPGRKLKLPKATSKTCTKYSIRITSRELTGTKAVLHCATFPLLYAPEYFVLLRRLQLEKQLQSQQLTEEERQNILQALERRERDFTRLQRQRMSASDFELLTIIGRGAFGEVTTLLCFSCCLWLLPVLTSWIPA